MSDEAKQKIVVTGGNGYIGSHIVRILLEHGHLVTAVVRDLKNVEKWNHLQKLPQQPGQLTFAESDIQEGRYEEIFKGASTVVHTATPYFYTAADPEKEIVKPAIDGTLAALEAALKVGVKRVVITSSGGAILRFPVPEGYVFTEKDWNEWSSAQNNPYFYSKTLAEKAAWKFYEDHKDKLEVVVVNPLFVIGPTLSPILNTSLKTVRSHLVGEAKSILPNGIGLVDVRDAAAAHVVAAENPAAAGKRLICCGVMGAWKDINKKLKEHFPQFPVTLDGIDSIPDPSKFSFDTNPLKGLGFGEFRNLDTMVKDTVASFIQHGVVQDVKA